MNARLVRGAKIAVVAACLVAALSPLFATRDLPLIDLPAHLGSVHIWNHHDEARYGYEKYYELSLAPVPYWAYYGFVHVTAYVMPLRWASKLFVGLSLVGAALGLLALLRAHGRPPWLALAGLALGWNYMISWGFLAFAGGIGPLLYAYALLARLADARPWPSRRLIAANVAMGFVLYFFHPLIFLLWLVGALVYVPNRLAFAVLPALAFFGWQFGQAKGAVGRDLRIQGIWDKPGKSLKMLYTNNVHGFLGPNWRLLLFLSLLTAFVAALLLVTDRDSRPTDRRPWKLLGALLLVYLVLPHHLEKPLGFAVMNIRVAIVVVLVACACVPAGVLRGWRAAVVAAPLVAITIGYSGVVAQRFARFDAHTRDFYAVVDRLPYDPAVLTLIYEPYDDSVRWTVWQKYPAYVQVERGGYDYALWDASQGIGESGFPVKPRGVPPASPPLGSPRSFSWDKHAAPYQYFLTKGEPAGVFSKRPELELVIARGPFKLWKKK